MNESEEKDNKKKKRALIPTFMVAFLVTLLSHIKFGLGEYGWKEMMGPTWGYYVLLLAVFLATFVAIFILFKNANKIKVELTEEEKKKRKTFRTEALFLIIDLIMTGSFVWINWEQITSVGIMWAIAEVAAFFAIVWFGFEFFNRFSFFPKRILNFFSGFLIKVCIPMLFLLIIMLGAYQEKYDYQDTFRPKIESNGDIFAENMKLAYTNLVTTLYDVGQSNPDLWIWLPIAAFFVMTLILLVYHFAKKEKTDVDKTAQEIIDESLKEQLEEEDYELGRKKRPMSYAFFKKIGDFLESKKEKEAKLKEKEEEKNMKYNIYDIKFTEMKGGKKE